MSRIACPTCDKDDMVQKITAIVGGETTTTSGYSSTSGSLNLSGSQNIYATDGSYIGQGKISGQGSSGSSTYTSAAQRSTLASQLQSPVKPSKPVEPHYGQMFVEQNKTLLTNLINATTLGFVAVLCLSGMAIVYLTSGSQGTAIVVGFFGGLLLFSAIMWLELNKYIPEVVGRLQTAVENLLDKMGVFDTTKQDYHQRVEQYEKRLQQYNDVAEPAWKRQTERWNKAFYCRRCDNVYIPGETKTAPPSDMKAVL